jgi:hypothetical protein
MLIKLSADEPSDSEFRIETAAALAPGLCIYVMLGPDMLLKVGMTDNLPRRARDLGHHPIVAFYFDGYDRPWTETLEALILGSLSLWNAAYLEQKYRGHELFNVSLNTAIGAVAHHIAYEASLDTDIRAAVFDPAFRAAIEDAIENAEEYFEAAEEYGSEHPWPPGERM